ncbi:MAG TPA: hypothetical protein VF766_00905 [Pyrinomonadaceae bacterium]
MRQITALLVTTLLTIALAACKGEKKASTPTEAFKLFYEAMKNKDVAAIKSLISKETLASMEAEAKSKDKSLDDYLAEESKSVPPSMPQLGEEKIDGDKATVQFKLDNAPNWSAFSFVKEDGGWKINRR